MRLENVKAGRKGNLNIATEIFQVAPSLHLVEVKKAKGDTLEFQMAIDIKPFGGLHIIYKTRCYVRLQKDDLCGALEDAKQALELAPRYAEVSTLCCLSELVS